MTAVINGPTAEHKFEPFKMPSVMGRKYTVGTDAFEYPEMKTAMLRLAAEDIDSRIERVQGDPTGLHQVQTSEPYEYDTVDEETGEPVHIGPLVDILVERAFWPTYTPPKGEA